MGKRGIKDDCSKLEPIWDDFGAFLIMMNFGGKSELLFSS